MRGRTLAEDFDWQGNAERHRTRKLSLHIQLQEGFNIWRSRSEMRGFNGWRRVRHDRPAALDIVLADYEDQLYYISASYLTAPVKRGTAKPFENDKYNRGVMVGVGLVP